MPTPVHRLNKATLGGILLVAIGLLAWGFLAGTHCDRACLRILFIGNSYTFGNDLPGTFVRLARSGGHTVQAEMRAEGGWTLSDHTSSPETLEKLKADRWDFVVLQEQSQIPAVERLRTQRMDPAARLLTRQVTAAGARPIFFMTWAHRHGWPQNGLPDYEAMQAQVAQGYLAIAYELGAPVAPVGEAWLLARRQHPELGLWLDDGSHPNQRGTYLAACVFYAAMFRQSPVGLAYTANLPEDTARALQTIAADAVLKSPRRWNLP